MTLVKDIQIFIGFANLYQCFIQDFNRIAILFISLLETTKSFEELTPKVFRANDSEVVADGSSRANEMVKNSAKNLTRISNIKAIRESNFLTSDAKKIFNYLRLAFIKVPIFQHFNLENQI